MKFEDLKKSLLEKVDYAYFLHGIDEYLLSSAYQLILKYSKLDFEDLNLIQFKEGIIDCSQVVRALETMPVFCDKKVVYLDLRMSKLSDIKNSKDLNEYLDRPNSSSVLIVNIGSNSAIKCFDEKKMISVDCDRLPFNIISLKIKQIAEKAGKTIDSNSIKLLNDFSLGDLAKIIVELNKLIGYVGDKIEITESDIKELVTPSIEYQVFELTDALSKKNSKRVFEIINAMKSKKEEFKTLPSLIFSHFRRLFMVALNQDKRQSELAQMLGVKEYAVKMTQMQIKLFSKSQLKKLNELCAKVDFDLKQSNISIDNAVSEIILNVLNI